MRETKVRFILVVMLTRPNLHLIFKQRCEYYLFIDVDYNRRLLLCITHLDFFMFAMRLLLFSSTQVKTKPDFGKLHAKFQQQLELKRQRRAITKPKPFSMGVHTVRAKHEKTAKIKEEIAADEHILNETRWPFSGKRTRVYSSKTLPIQVYPKQIASGAINLINC